MTTDLRAMVVEVLLYRTAPGYDHLKMTDAILALLERPEVIEAMALGRCGSGWNGPLCPAPCEDCIEDVRSAIRAVTGGAS